MVLAMPLLVWAGLARWDWGGGRGRPGCAELPVARRGLCAPPGVRFPDPSGVVAAGAAGCAVSEGLHGFMLEFTLL